VSAQFNSLRTAVRAVPIGSAVARAHVAGPLACCLAAVLCFGTVAHAADWPAYGADPARSGRTDETLQFPLEAAWTFMPLEPPRPAWPEPGKELHRLDFDYAPQPVIANGLVYFGSSADDSVRALDAATGKLRWRFTTDGPVRFAPEIAGGRAFVVSDDGWLYALDAATGALVWKFHAAPRDDQVLGNGRMISRWPIRSGPVVADGTVYLAAGMWPAHGIYLYAVDARTGEKLWCNDSSASMYRNQPHGGASAFTGVCPQGYMLVSGNLLLVPSGRTTPAAFDRQTGKLVYYQPYLYLIPYGSESWGSRGNGGWWATIAGESFLCSMHDPGAPELDTHVGEAEPRQGDGIVVYSLATGLRQLSLPDRYRAIIAGDMLYAAGKNGLEAIDLKAWREKKKLDGCVKWAAPAKTAGGATTGGAPAAPPQPRAYCLALAGTTLLAGGRGSLSAHDAATGKRVWSAETDGQVRGLAVAGGRLVAATSRGGIHCYESREISMPAVTVREAIANLASAPGAHVDRAAKVVKETGVSQGYALVVGERDSRLATALASRTDLHVIAALPPDADVDGERRRLLSSPLYGSRVAVQQLDGSERLPYAPYFADLVVVTGAAAGLSGAELYRVVRPCGGVLCFAGMKRDEVEGLLADVSDPRVQCRSADSLRMVVRGRLRGAGEWRYQWADGGNTAIGEESIVRPPFDLLWFGGPGPDRMMSRHWGASAPLSVAGRVFVAGQHHVIAFDAYNGRENWCSPLQGAGRISAEMRASNFVADDTSLFVASGAECHRLDQSTGKTIAVYRVPDIDGFEPRASASGAELAAVDIQWPAVWQLFGPVPKGSPVPPPATLQAIPAELTVGTKTFQPQPVRPVKGKVDFTHFFGGYGFKPLAADEKPEAHARGSGTSDSAMEGTLAFLFAEIECPSSGRLTIGAGADWWMQWFLDGKPFFDTLKNGNDAGQYGVTNHVFDATVTSGRHVLAVMVRAGSRGWCVCSAGGARYERNLRYVRPERMLPRWGYLSVAGDLVLGSYLPAGPKTEEWESRGLFALDKKDGSLRWQYRPQRTILNTSVAFGDGRIFVLDGTAPTRLFGVKQKDTLELSLLALELKTGQELWRQNDVPTVNRQWVHSDMRFVQYARHIVVVGGHAGYEAATGKKLWERPVVAGEDFRLPVIRDDWVIHEPQAFDLKTGEPRMVTDALTGQARPWKFTRAYGCGPVAGARNLLFFRSGTAGFYDFATDGTTTFGGMRPGCSITMVPANGLMVLPEGSSGCSCSYNFQTSLALVPARAGGNLWNVFHGERTESPLRSAAINCGAPGDRRDTAGVAWLAFPRPDVRGASPVPLRVVEGQPEYCCRASEASGADRAWLYASGMRGACKMVLDLARAPVVVQAVTDGSEPRAPADGESVAFEADAHLLAPKADLRIRRDAGNLYFVFNRDAAVRNGKPVGFAAKHTKKDDKNTAQDDSIVVSISDANRAVSLEFAVSCGGGTFGKKNTRKPEAVKDAEDEEEAAATGDAPAALAKRDTLWHGEWQSEVEKTADSWRASVTIPLKTLRAERLDLDSLQMNCTARNNSGQGPATIALTTAATPPLGGFVPMVFVAAGSERREAPERKYTVRLHFAETGAYIADRPAFDVELQGELVLSGSALVKEASGAGRAVVKEFRSVSAGGKLTLSLVPGADAGSKTKLWLCAMEVQALKER